MNTKSLVSTKRRKLLVTSIAILAVVCTTMAVYAAFTVTSNVVTVNLNYQVSLTAVPRNTNPSLVDLQAIVTSSGGYSVNNIPVNFYNSTDGGITWSYIATTNTDGGGGAAYTYTVLSAGIYSFMANATIP